jgi:hypothetical protein
VLWSLPPPPLGDTNKIPGRVDVRVDVREVSRFVVSLGFPKEFPKNADLIFIIPKKADGVTEVKSYSLCLVFAFGAFTFG